jgi:pyruvate dehydrogenase E1 component beta subunit
MSSTKMTLLQAINTTLDYALANDPAVFIIGEDIVDPKGGGFGQTKGLSTKYGTKRIREAPISEQAIVGASIGAAMIGAKPIVEIMVADFHAVCFDQVVNHAAKMRYMSGGRTTVPIVIRGLTGGGLNFGAQHSQSVEAWMANVPGLKVAIASNPADMKGILLEAIDDPDPVIVFEPLALYNTSGAVPDGPYKVHLGTAAVAREGNDVTVVSYGAQVPVALGAAERLAAEEGTEVEVIDLRWLVPWDRETVLTSVRKTRRCVILHQAVRRSGFGAEIAATVAEECFWQLDGPVVRIAGKNTPIPTSPALEDAAVPQLPEIISTLRRVATT